MSTTFNSRSARETARRTWAAREAARWIKVVKMHELPAWALEPDSLAAEVLPVAAEVRAELQRDGAPHVRSAQHLGHVCASTPPAPQAFCRVLDEN